MPVLVSKLLGSFLRFYSILNINIPIIVIIRFCMKPVLVNRNYLLPNQ